VGARRVVYDDRRVRPRAMLDWRADGALALATVRIPDGTWLTIEPRAAVEPPWGAVDRLTRAGAPVTVFRAVDWTRVRAIPALAEPARLPPGAGTAVLNLLATLAVEQGVETLAYDGPYPTETLFLALLECFHPEPADGDPLARFMHGALAWRPAPFTPCFDDAVYTQWRGRLEKVVWRGRAYYREDWGGVRRWAPLRVDDVAGGGGRCALWALGRPLEDHVVLDADGRAGPALAPPPATTPARPLAPAIVAGLVELVVALSAAPLAGALRADASTLAFTAGPLDRELARVAHGEARVARSVADAIAGTLGATARGGTGGHLGARPSREDMGGHLGARPSSDEARRAETALAALLELATALGDGLRARAQARLAAADAATQHAALGRAHAESPDAARTITAAVAALLASGRVDDEPDVEGGERRDRHD